MILKEFSSLKATIRINDKKQMSLKGMFAVLNQDGTGTFIGFVNDSIAPSLIKISMNPEIKVNGNNSLNISSKVFEPTKMPIKISNKLRIISENENKKQALEKEILAKKILLEKEENEMNKRMFNLERELSNNEENYKNMSIDTFSDLLNKNKIVKKHYTNCYILFSENSGLIMKIVYKIYPNDLDFSSTDFYCKYDTFDNMDTIYYKKKNRNKRLAEAKDVFLKNTDDPEIKRIENKLNELDAELNINNYEVDFTSNHYNYLEIRINLGYPELDKNYYNKLLYFSKRFLEISLV